MFYVYSTQKNSTNPSHPGAQDKTDKTQHPLDGERAHYSEKTQDNSQPEQVVYGPEIPKGGLPSIENNTVKDVKNKSEYLPEGPNLPPEMLKSSTNVEKPAPSVSEDKVGKDSEIKESQKEGSLEKENVSKKKSLKEIDGNKLETSKTGKSEKHHKRAESGGKSEKASSSRKSRRSKSPKKSPVQVGSMLDNNPGKRYLTQLAVKEILAITKRSVSQTDVIMTSPCRHDVTKRSVSQGDVNTSKNGPEEELSEENRPLETGVLNSDPDNSLDSAINQEINQSNDSAESCVENTNERKNQSMKVTSKKSQQALANIVGIILKRDVSGNPSNCQAETDTGKMTLNKSEIKPAERRSPSSFEVTSEGQKLSKVAEKGQGQMEDSSKETEALSQGQTDNEGQSKVNKEGKGHEKVITKGQDVEKVGQKVIW